MRHTCGRDQFLLEIMVVLLFKRVVVHKEKASGGGMN